MNSHKTAILLITSLIALAACTQNSNPDACTVDKPPKNSRVQPTHGVDFKLYPAEIPPHYSGCAKVWLDNGYLLMLIKLEDGIVRYVEANEPDQAKITCEFDKEKKLVKGPADECARFSQFPVSK